MNIFLLIVLLGGLTFFLYGMNVMSSNLEKLAGGRLETLLRQVTSRKFMGLALGAFVTIAVQSSSAVTVMLVGLVNSGVMQFGQSISIIFGAKIGTTLTAWILSLSGIESDVFFIKLLKPEYFSLIFAFVGILYNMFSHSDRKKSIGTIFIGFAVLMYGMELMKDAVEPLAELPQFQAALTKFSNPLLCILISAIFTGVIQSSAASIGILQLLSAGGGISYTMAIPIVMGQNIGTCVTALISCIGTRRQAKRVAVMHLLINVIGSVILLLLFYLLNGIFDFAFASAPVNAVSIAIIHTAFNILAACILMPVSGLLESMVVKIVPEKENEASGIPLDLDDRLLNTPSAAVAECLRVMTAMAHLAHETIISAIRLLTDYDAGDAEQVMKNEEIIDSYEDKLGNYLVRLSSKSLSNDDSLTVGKILHAIGDFERLGDHAVNLTESAKELHDKQLAFSQQGSREIGLLSGALLEILDMSVSSVVQDEPALAAKVEPLEEVIDRVVNEVKMLHIKRLQTGKCTIELGFIFSDILTNFERISDHCSNIALATLEAHSGHFNAHEYLNDIKSLDNDSFNTLFEEYHKRYEI